MAAYTQSDIDALAQAKASAQQAYDAAQAQEDSQFGGLIALQQHASYLYDQISKAPTLAAQADAQAAYDAADAQAQAMENAHSIFLNTVKGPAGDAASAAFNAYEQAMAQFNASQSQAAAIDDTPKPSPSVVSSGSGDPVPSTLTGPNAQAVAAGNFAYGSLGGDLPGTLSNASLVDTNTILPNTQKTVISKDQLNAADTNYTTAMNQLSAFQAAGDTSSPEYQAAKQNAVDSQYKWELARNNLEEVASTDQAGLSDNNPPVTALQGTDIVPTITPVDLGPIPTVSQTPVATASTDAAPDPIVVTGHKTALDPRIRIKAQTSQVGDLYSGITDILNETNGVVFPFTPTITLQHRAEYSKMSPTHANTDYWIYTNTPAPQIQIQGQFSAQNLKEAKYLLAATHFFRTVTKMHFGSKDPQAGLPPPVLLLNGYGTYMFNNLNIIITDFSMDMPNNVDYIEVPATGGTAWVPSLTNISVTCVVQQTPAMQRDDFNFKAFASGDLLAQKGWI